METVDQLFREADRDGDGRIGPTEAQTFFPRFGLASTALGAIWQAVVRNPVSGMARDEFQLSLRLISLLQRGAPMDSSTLQLAMTQPQPLPSSIAVASSSFTNTAAPAASPLAQVPAADRAHYSSIWMKLLLPNGLLEAKDALELLSKSGLPPDELNQIWAVADADQDNRLTQDEFILAMHLVNQRRSALASAQIASGGQSAQAAAALRGLSESVQASKATQSSLVEKSRALATEHDDSVAVAKKLQAELEQLQVANKQLEASCLERQQQISALKTNAEAVKATLLGERQKAEMLRASLAQLEAELQGAMSQYTQMQQELAQASQTLPNMEAQRAIMEQQLEQMRRQTQSNEEEIVKLHSIVQSQRDMAGQYQNMLNGQQSARDSLQQQIAEQNRQLEAMASAAATVQADNQLLVQSLNDTSHHDLPRTSTLSVPTASLFDLDPPSSATVSAAPPSSFSSSSPFSSEPQQPANPPPSSPTPALTTSETESPTHDAKRRHNRPLSTFWKGGGKKDAKSKEPKSPKKEVKSPKPKKESKKESKKGARGKSAHAGGSVQLTEDTSGDLSPASVEIASDPRPLSQQDLGSLFPAAPDTPSSLPQGLETLFSSLSPPAPQSQPVGSSEPPSPFAVATPTPDHSPFPTSLEGSQLFSTPAPFGSVDFNPFSQTPQQDALPPSAVDFSNLFSSAS